MVLDRIRCRSIRRKHFDRVLKPKGCVPRFLDLFCVGLVGWGRERVKWQNG